MCRSCADTDGNYEYDAPSRSRIAPPRQVPGTSQALGGADPLNGETTCVRRLRIALDMRSCPYSRCGSGRGVSRSLAAGDRDPIAGHPTKPEGCAPTVSTFAADALAQSRHHRTDDRIRWCLLEPRRVPLRRSDCSGGIANQHAQAVHFALRLAEDASPARIRVEGYADAVDVEVWGQAANWSKPSSTNAAISATRGAGRSSPTIADWSRMGAQHPDGRYRFFTDGRLRPAGRRVRDALMRAADGDTTDIAPLMRKASGAVDLDAGRPGRHRSRRR